MNREYKVNNAGVPFRNAVGYCVGTGRMGLALQKEYQEQLKFVQDEIGFSYIRGHGLFSDDMAIYQTYEDENGNTHSEYNFTYLDWVMDFYQSVKIKPFLELGFMPDKMASGKQTVFYWKGNVTPPENYGKWTNMVQATLRHLMNRYGVEEVLTWPVEVWNEPNLKGFWENADMNEYFHLYDVTVKAVKEVDERFQIGGPAICGGADELWMKGFLNHVRETKVPMDFITRHHYTTEFPKPHGHYANTDVYSPEKSYDTLRDCRKIIDSFEEFKDMPFYITEFNTSYIPNAPVHDTNFNAAYLADQLSVLGDFANGYSYWTFGDVFEEKGVPFTPFHGGFGMVANGGIPKPTFWTFDFYKKLSGICLHRSSECVVTKGEDGVYRGVAWNTAMSENQEELHLSMNLGLDMKEGCLITKTVDEDCANPLKVWHDLGEPASPSKDEIKLLKEAAMPLVQTQSTQAGDVTIELTLSRNSVVYFEWKERQVISDRGYDYSTVDTNVKE